MVKNLSGYSFMLNMVKILMWSSRSGNLFLKFQNVIPDFSSLAFILGIKNV